MVKLSDELMEKITEELKDNINFQISFEEKKKAVSLLIDKIVKHISFNIDDYRYQLNSNYYTQEKDIDFARASISTLVDIRRYINDLFDDYYGDDYDEEDY